MFNNGLVRALLIAGLGIAVAGCEGNGPFGGFGPKTEAAKPKAEPVKPKAGTAPPATPRTQAAGRSAIVAGVSGPGRIAGTTRAARTRFGGRRSTNPTLSISAAGTFHVSGSRLVVKVDAGILSSAFYSQTLAVRPYHPRDTYVWTEGSGRLVYDINLKTLSQTVAIEVGSPGSDEYQSGDELELALLEVPRRNAAPIQTVSRSRMIFYEDDASRKATLLTEQIDELGQKLIIALPANAARAFRGIGEAVLHAELDDEALGIELKVVNDVLPRDYPANTRLFHVFTIVPASEDDEDGWAKAHAIPRSINLFFAGQRGQILPEVDGPLTVRGTTY